MSTDIRDRLRKLGVHKGAAHVTPKPKRTLHAGLEALIDGEVIETDYGPIFVHTERYAPDHAHGRYALGAALSQSPSIAAQLAALDNDEIDLRRAAFIDTETTGLAGGTGTLAFLIGVGAFDPDNAFTVRQYFLRSPAEEPAALLHLADWLDQFDAVVSFNGRGFDLPLLQTRFTLQRLRPRILTAPHLDLLTPARRVWRNRLESCRLSSLEDHILDVHRDQADVPGFLIPQLYFDYLRTGDAGEMPRVLYHNTYDILSMVTLSTHLIQLFDQAQIADRNAGDLYALGKWHADQDQIEQAEIYLRQAMASAEDVETRHAAALRLALIYKQIDRRSEALPLWEAATDRATTLAVEACIELAKHYEWHDRQLKRALKWTQQGLKLAAKLPDAFVREESIVALTHRLERL
ncbi:MAG TPA: ribonuclease H-like domain-containing protein, partial [Anaerolineae bacterium]